VPSDTRDRLTHGVFMSPTSNHPVCFMERALPQVIQAEPLERKLLKALKLGEISGITWDDQVQNAIEKHVLTKEEADILLRVRELVAEIIAVDDFDVEDLRLGNRSASRLDTQHAA
jgi:acyl-CoA dehydrogenase